jgi:glycosyltransferase involved in cell wall biosynthesis
MSAEKGPDFLIAAVRHLVDADARFKLAVYGETPERSRTEEVIQAFGLQDHFQLMGPYQGRQQLHAVMRNHEIFLLASLFECMPLALIEAAAYAKVSVATAVGGIPEFFSRSPAAGVVVPPGDPRSLADAVLEVCSDGSLDERKRAARLLFETHYESGAMTDRLLRLFKILTD